MTEDDSRGMDAGQSGADAGFRVGGGGGGGASGVSRISARGIY